MKSALVRATWTDPNGWYRLVNGVAGSDGVIIYTFPKARCGSYYPSVKDVNLDGYVYDPINSTTIGVFLKNK